MRFHSSELPQIITAPLTLRRPFFMCARSLSILFYP